MTAPSDFSFLVPRFSFLGGDVTGPLAGKMLFACLHFLASKCVLTQVHLPYESNQLT